jgi:uncharacterized protein
VGRLATKLVDFLSKRKLLFFVLLIVCIAILLAGTLRIRLNEDIFSALPEGKAFRQLNTLVESKNITNQVVFAIDVKPGQEIDPEELLDDYAGALQINAKGLITGIKTIRPDVELQVYAHFYTHFPFLINEQDYLTIDTRLSNDSIRKAVSTSFNQVTSPGSPFLHEIILNDPLFISADFFKRLNPGSSSGIVVEDGIVYAHNKSKIIVTAKTAFNAREGEKNIELHNLLQAFVAEWNAVHPKNNTSYFGTFDIAAANAIQVKKDTRLTLFITIGAILFILVFYYRKLLIPVYFILPALFGGLLATGVTGFLRPEVSAISLATSAVLFGIIIDYSFHFFTHLRHTRSIKETLLEITGPLLTGSITTILALAALSFANSRILQDFGLFAALGLSGAAAFTLIGLPVLLDAFRFNYNNIPEPVKITPPRLGRFFKPLALVVILLLTGVFMYTSQKIQFDSDLDNLSFHPDELKDKEAELSGINPAKEKRIYAFASATADDQAQLMNFSVYEKVHRMKQDSLVKSYVSAAPFYIPPQLKKEREQKWMEFWSTRKDSVFTNLHQAELAHGFTEKAFDNFRVWITREREIETAGTEEPLPAMLGLDDLVERTPEKTTYITTIVVADEHLATVKKALAGIPGITVFDRAETAGALLESVKDDFNYTLLVSASIVFLTLLLIYGRIELTLLAFMPMVISWIWILGIAALAGIKFNFVNVVISTFIFGLGDDFSIFVTDGLLHKYKYRRNNLESYTSAIILSAVATIIGTGVLFFARHPAIHSVSAISVLGVSCILVLSLVFQPILFDFFVQKRIEKNKSPLSAFNLFCSVVTIGYFVISCLLFYPVLFVLAVLPLPKKKKTSVLNAMISAFAKSVLYFGIHVRKNIEGKENLDWNKPALIIANHASFLDILLMIMLNRKVIIMVKDWVHKSPLFGFAVRMAGYIYSEDAPEQNLEKVKQRIADGYSLMIFPEGSRSADGEIKRFHKGAFFLAQELNLDIIPILIHGASDVSPKREYLVKSGSLNLRILPRIHSNDTSWGTTYQERTKNISSYFKTQYAVFKDEKESPAYLWPKVFNNYIYKGPVLEWYGKIKWKFESANYRFYHTLLADRINITDIGCGYGYLDFYLHYKNNARKITAVDYDEEKINIAANSYGKTDHLAFVHDDVEHYHIPPAQDAIFLFDVLHYMPESVQKRVLQRCYEALNINGLLLIRDGITDLEQRHETTKKTERWSTRIIGFNKREKEFHFFASSFVRDFAAKNNMNLQIHEQSEKTSNVLFILTKK